MLADRQNSEPIKILYEIKDKEKLLNDILEIKRNGFEANYSIAHNAHTTQQRPLEFKGGFEEWLFNIKQIHLKEEKERELRHLQMIKNRETFVSHIMDRIMRIY